jgi:hypothetical protein
MQTTGGISWRTRKTDQRSCERSCRRHERKSGKGSRSSLRKRDLTREGRALNRTRPTATGKWHRRKPMRTRRARTRRRTRHASGKNNRRHHALRSAGPKPPVPPFR